MTRRQKSDFIIERSRHRQYFYEVAIRLFDVVESRRLRMILENPYSTQHFLVNNFPYKAALIDNNRRMRGDYFVKPTQYWYVNCKPTRGESYQQPKITKTICSITGSKVEGLCGEERSLISPDYARNFICDFILGRVQKNTVVQLNINF